MSLLAEVTSKRSLEEIDEITKKLIDQQREDEERCKREDEASEPDLEPDKDDKDNLDSGAALDQISRELEAHQIMKTMVSMSINVGTCWRVCNKPDASGWYICLPHLVDAYVINVAMRRRIVAEVYAMTLMYYTDAVSNIMPPHCRLIGKPHEHAKANPHHLHVEEIALMVQFDGLLAASPRDDDDLLIAVLSDSTPCPSPGQRLSYSSETRRSMWYEQMLDSLFKTRGGSVSCSWESSHAA
jgi:hypothetical protein